MGSPAVLAIEIVSDTRRAADGIERTNTQLGKFGKAAGIAAGAMAVFAVAKPLVDFGVEAFKAAAAAETAMLSVETVFEGSAQTILDWSDDAAKAFGITREEANRMSAVLGAQLQGLGFDLKESARLTLQLNERAADMAAVMGGTTAEAIERVGALLRGERDPIEKYGVSIKQADINAWLLAENLDHLEGEARKQAEAQAALALMFDQTAKMEGAAAENADTAAASMQRLDAQMQNLKETIGGEMIKTWEMFRDELGLTETDVGGLEDGVKRLGSMFRDTLRPVIWMLKPAIDSIRAGFQSLEEAGIGVEEMMMGLKPILYIIMAPIYALAGIVRGLAWTFEKLAAAIAWAKRQVDNFRLPSWLGGSSSGSRAGASSLAWGAATTTAPTFPRLTATTTMGGRSARPTSTVVVQGLIVDPEGTARQMRAIERGHRRRAFVPAAVV